MTVRKAKAPAASTGALDLGSFDDAVKRQDKGIPVPILSMDGKSEIGLTITVAGPDSERARSAQEAMADELIDRGTNDRPKAKEAVERSLRYLAKITIGWTPSVKLDDKEMGYSEANAAKLYKRLPFIREQVDRAAGDRSRFFPG
ncbi:hypothetical protein [Amorphus sp. MBR-141]